MSIHRRHFMKAILGSGLVAFSVISIKPISENLECKIQRLFAQHPAKRTPELCTKILGNQALTLLKADSELLQLSDKSFIKVLEKKIRQDFSDGRIIGLAGWQLASTEVAIIHITRADAV